MSSLIVLIIFCTALTSALPNGEKPEGHIEPVISEKHSSESSPNAASSTSDVDDRIGLNLNRGHAFAYGPQGFSGSDSNTFGFQAGIKRPGNYYSPLFSQTGGQGSSFSTGPGAPNTWAGGNTGLGNGYLGGNSGAGFNGALGGQANADSFTQQFEIPIYDGYGTTILSNFKDKKHESVPSPDAKARTKTNN